MRPGCWDCAYKHVAAASVASDEYSLGYPKFKLYIVGNLDHAATEIARRHRELAMLIRQHRINFMNDPLGYEVPYEELGAFIDACAAAVDSGMEPPGIDSRADYARGLAVGVEGELVFDEDTRT